MHQKQYGDPLYFLNVGTGKDITILAEKIAINTGFKGEILWDHKPDGTPKKQLKLKKKT